MVHTLLKATIPHIQVPPYHTSRSHCTTHPGSTVPHIQVPPYHTSKSHCTKYPGPTIPHIQVPLYHTSRSHRTTHPGPTVPHIQVPPYHTSRSHCTTRSKPLYYVPILTNVGTYQIQCCQQQITHTHITFPVPYRTVGTSHLHQPTHVNVKLKMFPSNHDIPSQ